MKRYTCKCFDRLGKKEAEFYPSGYPQPYTWLSLHSLTSKCIDIESHHRKILLKSTSAKYPRSCYGIDWREIWMEYFSKIDVLSLFSLSCRKQREWISSVLDWKVHRRSIRQEARHIVATVEPMYGYSRRCNIVPSHLFLLDLSGE